MIETDPVPVASRGKNPLGAQPGSDDEPVRRAKHPVVIGEYADRRGGERLALPDAGWVRPERAVAQGARAQPDREPSKHDFAGVVAEREVGARISIVSQVRE